MILMNLRSRDCIDLEKKVLIGWFEWITSYRILLKLIHSAEKKKL